MTKTTREKKEYPTLKSLTRMELFVLGAEVNSTKDRDPNAQEFMDAIMDELKSRKDTK